MKEEKGRGKEGMEKQGERGENRALRITCSEQSLKIVRSILGRLLHSLSENRHYTEGALFKREANIYKYSSQLI